MSRSLFCMVLALYISTSSVAISREISDFDLMGVKTGMTQTEAVNAIMERLGLKKEQISFDPLVAPNIFTGDRFFSVETDLYKVKVEFVANVPPYDKGAEMLVNLVQYTVPWDFQFEEGFNILDPAKKKYGEPTTEEIGIRACWIQNSAPNADCFNDYDTRDGPFVLLGGTVMILRDYSYQEKFFDHVFTKQDIRLFHQSF